MGSDAQNCQRMCQTLTLSERELGIAINGDVVVVVANDKLAWKHNKERKSVFEILRKTKK